jgi:hypothetical protein
MKNFKLLLLLLILISCGKGNKNSNNHTISVDSDALMNITKYEKGDPFIETIKNSEFFEVSGLKDNVIETKSGTIISIPKGAFRDSRGNIVEKKITVEITDINSFEEQFNANINSTSGQNILLNGGALYINATSDGSQLTLNNDSPIYVELIQESNPDLLIFEGIRDEKGEMKWLNPKQPKKYLIPVDLSVLDFLPSGFANEVVKNIPFGRFKEANSRLIDSLYYSLIEKEDASDSMQRIPEMELLIVPVNNTSNSSYEHVAMEIDEATQDTGYYEIDFHSYCDAIKPASVKALKSSKFSKTFISTKQFEERMQTIHKTRKQEVLEVYVNNLSQNLSYCDSLASTLFNTGSTYKLKFSAFAKENWSNIKDLPSSVKNLGRYYSSRLKRIENELLSLKREYESALKKKSKEAAKLRADYRKLLTKRQHYRLKKHGFTLKKLGWIAPGIIIEPSIIKLKVDGGDKFDRVHVYTIDPSIKSIFAWKSLDKINFNFAFAEDSWLIYKKYQKAKAIVVAYRKDEVFYDLEDFIAANK